MEEHYRTERVIHPVLPELSTGNCKGESVRVAEGGMHQAKSGEGLCID